MIRIVNFKGGLGNQILIYCFSQYLKNSNNKNKVYGLYQSKNLKTHNGLEIEKVFNVTLPPTNYFCSLFVFIIKVLSKLGITQWYSTELKYKKNAIYFDGTWMNYKYLKDEYKYINFNTIHLNKQNQFYLEQIEKTNSIFIHVRRGDYLSSKHFSTYNNICTEEYYINAINYMQTHIRDAHYFIFSDDISWVKQKLDLPKSTFINCNQNENSYIDLYLMSKCKNCIIANSTFSYWAALLGNSKKYIIYPQKWMNTRTPDLFPNNWIAINNKGDIK